MRFALMLAAAAIGVVAIAPEAEAQARKRRGETVIVVKQRPFLDAGTQVLPGTHPQYTVIGAPWRPADSIVPTGSIQRNLLPGPYGPFHY